MRDINDILDELDALFRQNRINDAENLLLQSREDAREENDLSAVLLLSNELMGLYRELSRAEEMLQAIEESLTVAKELNLEGTIPYATTILNAANAYRAIGELDRSMEYYGIAAGLYEKLLSPDDMLIASLYNNISLLYQEKEDFEQAEKYLLMALRIVQDNEEEFEIAVTYANLANTAVMAKRYSLAKEYAEESLRRFIEIDCMDTHYASALSAMGMCLFLEEDFEQAARYFTSAMDAVEENLGQNEQYLRLQNNYLVCMQMLGERKKAASGDDANSATAEANAVTFVADTMPEDVSNMNGLQLSEAYYSAYFKPLLTGKYAAESANIAVGLVGEGSDCFGYDDEVSRDHDWGPDFCIWVADEADDRLRDELLADYTALPQEFSGIRRAPMMQGAGRRGVMKVSDYYKRLIGTDRYEDIDWTTVADASLAAAVNGKVFNDPGRLVNELRYRLLEGYPEQIQYLKLAEDAAAFSQNGQYNLKRALTREDKITANILLSDSIRGVMRMVHHMLNQYPPHDKWLHRSFVDLISRCVRMHDNKGETAYADEYRELLNCVDSMQELYSLDCEAMRTAAEPLMERVGEILATKLYRIGLISDVDPYLDHHTEELLQKSRWAAMSDTELVDEVVRVEFEAFDKVQNEGGRASCQNNFPVFRIMRASQYLTWNRPMLIQYLYDFVREYRIGHNLITEKYGRMMESTAPERYAEIAVHFPKISEQKKAIIEQVVAIQMAMMEEFGREYPKTAQDARSFHSYEDNAFNTSYETYLRGEISTYSDKMLQLYAGYVVQCAKNGVNIAKQTIGNTTKLYGYDSLEQYEAHLH